MSEPSLGEVMRRLEDVVGQMQAVTQRMDRQQEANDKTFVRRDVYDARHTNLTRRLELMEKETDEREKASDAFRRQAILVVISVALPAIIALLLAINNFLASGGRTP